MPVVAGLASRRTGPPEVLAAILGGVAITAAAQLGLGVRLPPGLTPAVLGLIASVAAWALLSVLRTHAAAKTIVPLVLVAVCTAPASAQAQKADRPLPVSLERIRAALKEPPPALRLPVSGDIPTFRVEVRQPMWVFEPRDEEPLDPTMGIPSAGELVMGGIGKIHSAAVRYKRNRAKRRAKKEVEDALSAFCAVHECPATDTPK